MWATSAFTFESHNHVFINMFQGTQCVPQHITETFTAASLVKSWVDDDSSVKDFLVRLTDTVRFKYKNDCSGLFPIGSPKLVTLDACRILAVEDLLNINLYNYVRNVFEGYVCNHQIYSSVNYVKLKHHTN